MYDSGANDGKELDWMVVVPCGVNNIDRRWTHLQRAGIVRICENGVERCDA